jgi:hypothetical protein
MTGMQRRCGTILKGDGSVWGRRAFSRREPRTTIKVHQRRIVVVDRRKASLAEFGHRGCGGRGVRSPLQGLVSYRTPTRSWKLRASVRGASGTARGDVCFARHSVPGASGKISDLGLSKETCSLHLLWRNLLLV